MDGSLPMGDGFDIEVVIDQLRRSVPGGTGTYALGLIQGLVAARTHDVAITLRASRRATGPDLLEGLPFPLSTWPLRQPWSQPLVDVGLFRASHEAALLHTVTLGGPRPRKGQLATLAVHDLLWRSPEMTLTRRGIRWHERAYQRARSQRAGVVTGARSVGDELIADGWPSEDVIVIPHGTDHVAAPDLDAARTLLEARGVTGPYIVTASTLEPRKNLARLVQAHRSVRAAGFDLSLVVVGPTGWGNAGLINADATVVAVGHVPSSTLSGLLVGASLVAHVALAEGYGLPVAEAMALGCAVVASTTTPSAVELGAGVLVDPLDVDAIATGIISLLHDDGRRRAAQVHAAQATASLTWARSATAHLNFWRQRG